MAEEGLSTLTKGKVSGPGSGWVIIITITASPHAHAHAQRTHTLASSRLSHPTG